MVSYINICPCCGEIDADATGICPYCKSATISTDIDMMGDFWNLYFEIKGQPLQDFLNMAYDKYVYN